MNIQSEVRAVHATMALTHFAQIPTADATAAAATLSENELTTLESILTKLAGAVPASNGAAQHIEAIRAYVPGPGAVIVRERDTRAAEGPSDDSGGFGWKKIGKADAAHYEGSYKGLSLAVLRRGPADYVGQIDGRQVAKGKFKKIVREHVEREAAKRAK